MKLRVARVLADGVPRTASQLARALGTSRESVTYVIQQMLAGNHVCVTGTEPVPAHRGVPARLFACGPVPVNDPDPTQQLPAHWPRANPDLSSGIDAMVRQRAPE